MGEINIEYDPGSLAAWLHNNEFTSPQYQVPAHVYTSRYNHDSLLLLRNKFISFETKYGFPFKNRKLENMDAYEAGKRRKEAAYINSAFDTYTHSYKLEKPLNFYLLNRLLLLKRFVIHTGTGLLPYKLFSEMRSQKDIVGIISKVFFALNYVVIIVTGSVGLLLFFLNPTSERLLIISCAAYGMLVFPFFVGTIDIRFLTLAFPFLIVASGFTLTFFVEKIKFIKYKHHSRAKGC
jgi:hypothetical protein